jgi:hypothetical protein
VFSQGSRILKRDHVNRHHPHSRFGTMLDRLV